MQLRFSSLLFLYFINSSCVERSSEYKVQGLVSIEIDDLKAGLIEDFIIQESLDTVRLEETDESLIGVIDKIQEYKGRFYILDIRITNSVFIFGDDGKYLGKIHSVGDGYGSYYMPFDMIVNPFTDRIEIMDVRLRKILSYSLDGEFIEEWRIEEQLSDFAPIAKDMYVFHRDGREFDPGLKHPLLTIGNPTNTVSLLEGVWEYGITDYYWINNKFSHFNFERLLYMHPMHDTIYEVNKESIKPVYFIDFKEKRVPWQIKSYDIQRFHQEFSNKDYYMPNGNLVESSQFLSFLFLRKERGWENRGDDFNSEVFLTIYDKKSGKCIYVPISMEDAMRNARSPLMAKENYFYTIQYLNSSEAFKSEPNPSIIKFQLNSF